VHGNGEEWDPIGPMVFHGNGNKIGMGMKCMGMGIKTWKWENTAYRTELSDENGRYLGIAGWKIWEWDLRFR